MTNSLKFVQESQNNQLINCMSVSQMFPKWPIHFNCVLMPKMTKFKLENQMLQFFSKICPRLPKWPLNQLYIINVPKTTNSLKFVIFPQNDQVSKICPRLPKWPINQLYIINVPKMTNSLKLCINSQNDQIST